jgi:hypothetical protein
MSGQIPRPFASIALVATLLISGVGVTAPPTTAGADDCLTAPNSPAPQGSHWYYRSNRATKRKCWYVRAPDQPAQQAAAPTTMGHATSLHSPPRPTPVAAGAPMSLSPGDPAAPPPHVKILAVKPMSAQAITATPDKLVQRGAQEGNTAPSIPEVPAAQASTSSQTSAQAAGPAPAAPVAWPDAPPAVATVKPQELIAVPTDAPAASVSDDAEKTARRGEPTNNAGMPMIIFPGLALGLAAVGILSLVVRKIAAARRARIINNHPEPDKVDDQSQQERRDDKDQHERRDDPDHERQEYHSLISAVSDYTPLPAEDGAFETIPEISKREDKLAQLRQDLDRMLQSPASPHEEPLRGRTAA